MGKDQMFFASAVTTEPLLRDALHRIETKLLNQLGDRTVDLAVIFLSAHFRGMAAKVRDGIQSIFQPAQIIGCAAEGIISKDQEIEQSPGISLLLAKLPDVQFSPFYLSSPNWELFLEDNKAFLETVAAPPETRIFFLFGDPFSVPMDRVLGKFNDLYPGVPVLGGLASAAMAVGQNALILNDVVKPVGAVGLALAGDFGLDLVVSQGSRPIGDPYVVTSSSYNVIQSLENQPPLFRIQEIVDDLSPEEQILLQRGLLIGRAINPTQEQLGRGDFLIRGVLAADHHTGSITVGDHIQPGEIIQFHVRDAETALDDLEMMLIPQIFRPTASGALLFTCNGRGTRLFDHENGDITIVQKSLNNVPLAGFFCAGEIGPVGDQNFIHGHTACLAVFRPHRRTKL